MYPGPTPWGKAMTIGEMNCLLHDSCEADRKAVKCGRKDVGGLRDDGFKVRPARSQSRSRRVKGQTGKLPESAGYPEK